MISAADYSKIIYHKPSFEFKGNEISTLAALDSEAYDNGVPFMVCTDDGREYDPSERDFLYNLISDYSGRDIATYNLKYDSGALLYFVPDELRNEIREQGFCVMPCDMGNIFTFKTITIDKKGKVREIKRRVRGIKIEYIPHKFLALSLSRHFRVRIWDICQFFAMSLDKAAAIYLNDHKKNIETKRFTREYVEKNRPCIKEYCIYDARLTVRLANFFVDKIKQFGIRTTALYSNASLSFRYFADRTDIQDVWRFHKYYPDLLRYAIEAYEGGKFEITARGAFTGYEYDIVSAYPYNISQLANIQLAEIVKDNKYRPDAYYGFVRVRINNTDGQHLPCGIIRNNVRVYPAGRFYTTITKGELEYLRINDIDHEIISAYWMMIDKIKFPYAEIIRELFDLKTQYKKSGDKALLMLAKIMMNSFYGKTCQTVKKPDGRFELGAAFNPIHASVITANTRIVITDIQRQLKDACLAAHTDSVIITKPLNPLLVTGQIGGFDLQDTGAGVIIACGQYQIADKCAFKGFDSRYNENWDAILRRSGNKMKIPYPVTIVESWIESAAKGHKGRVNLFQETLKNIDLNADTKRGWPGKTSAKGLLRGLTQSFPRIIIENKRPASWT